MLEIPWTILVVLCWTSLINQFPFKDTVIETVQYTYSLPNQFPKMCSSEPLRFYERFSGAPYWTCFLLILNFLEKITYNDWIIASINKRICNDLLQNLNSYFLRFIQETIQNNSERVSAILNKKPSLLLNMCWFIDSHCQTFKSKPFIKFWHKV